MPNRVWDTPCWVANPKKSKDELGWKARTSFEEGFRKFVQWIGEEPGRREHYEQAHRSAI